MTIIVPCFLIPKNCEVIRNPAGKTVGLVGKVGSGKSTILRLILRQFDNYEGTIKFGGIDIKKYKMDALIPAIGYVPQDTFLFSESIRENIRFARGIEFVSTEIRNFLLQWN